MASASLLEPPQMENFLDFSNVVVIDGLPIVSPDKFARLAAFVQTKFAVHGKIIEETTFMPLTETEPKGTLGFVPHSF